MTREELEKAMGNEPKIQASFEGIGDDVKFIKLIVNGKEKVVSIEELEKTLPEPCDDCISRAELLKAVDTWDRFGCDAGSSKLVPVKDCYIPYIHYDDVVKAIKGMPSIHPTAKENLAVEDCISREEVCDYIAEFVNHEYATDRERELVKNIIGGIQHLPSIQPKTGHWISKHIVDDCNGVVTWYECSECGRCVDETITEEFMLKDYPYCHCGAKMIPTDSNCDSCEYQNEVDGSNCYECVKDIRNNYKAESEE